MATIHRGQITRALCVYIKQFNSKKRDKINDTITFFWFRSAAHFVCKRHEFSSCQTEKIKEIRFSFGVYPCSCRAYCVCMFEMTIAEESRRKKGKIRSCDKRPHWNDANQSKCSVRGCQQHHNGNVDHSIVFQLHLLSFFLASAFCCRLHSMLFICLAYARIEIIRLMYITWLDVLLDQCRRRVFRCLQLLLLLLEWENGKRVFSSATFPYNNVTLFSVSLDCVCVFSHSIYHFSVWYCFPRSCFIFVSCVPVRWAKTLSIYIHLE